MTLNKSFTLPEPSVEKWDNNTRVFVRFRKKQEYQEALKILQSGTVLGVLREDRYSRDERKGNYQRTLQDPPTVAAGSPPASRAWELSLGFSGYTAIPFSGRRLEVPSPKVFLEKPVSWHTAYPRPYKCKPQIRCQSGNF